MSLQYYAGIGSRKAPPEILGLCRRIAEKLRDDWTLRTGHAIGCDQAFELGAGAFAHVFLPWHDFEVEVQTQGAVWQQPQVRAESMVDDYHPAPHLLSTAARKLHARNCHILLGPNLDDPVKKVICWTRNENRGGTALGVRIAHSHGIPVHNLYESYTRRMYEDLCDHQMVLPVD